MKSQEVPKELKAFYAEFRKLEYRHNYITVFDDFLSAMMNYFTPPPYPGIDVTCFNKYSKEERMIIGSLIPITVQMFNEQITAGGEWFDPFGDFYQMLASRSKQAALGQFFTPATLVDVMNMMTSSDLVNLMTGAAANVGAESHGTNTLIGKGLTVNDPTCGSGRMLIAFHAKNPGNYVFGEDLDPMCCKMACINLMIHGCEGEIVNHNSLQPDDYIQGWSINADIRKTGLPSIRPLAKEKSFVYRMWHKESSETQQQKVAINVRDKKTKVVEQQLDIFS